MSILRFNLEGGGNGVPFFSFKKKKNGKKFHRKGFGFNTDTKIGPLFWFLILKPGFGHGLGQTQGVNFIIEFELTAVSSILY